MAIYKEGCTNKAVVQEIQRAVGCYPDGIWGRLTTESVKAWQQAHGLTPDGIVGPKTLEAMASQKTTGSPQTAVNKDSVLIESGDGSVVRLKRSKRQIDALVVHCTATPEGRNMTVDELRRQHKKQGWADIGYHYVIDLDGHILTGRDVDISGAHVSGHNAHTIGIVYVGGLNSRQKAMDTRTDAQRRALRTLLESLRLLYPTAAIKGHRDYSPDLDHDGQITSREWIKACPCFNAATEYADI